MKRLIFAALFAVCFAGIAAAQPRPMDKTPGVTARQAPATFEANYEGGMFGYSDKIAGTLNFDDANQRLVFRGKDQKEKFSVAYESILVIYPQSQSVTSTTGSVVSHIPLPGAGLAGLIKSKRRYLVMQYSDADVDVKGTINFKIDDKALLDSALQTLADKAKLTQRGDAYYRPKTVKSDT
ncbi:MAG: hypothetical protein ACKVQJ_00165 [Pyrinomonadaceae bacterium]